MFTLGLKEGHLQYALEWPQSAHLTLGTGVALGRDGGSQRAARCGALPVPCVLTVPWDDGLDAGCAFGPVTDDDRGFDTELLRCGGDCGNALGCALADSAMIRRVSFIVLLIL